MMRRGNGRTQQQARRRPTQILARLLPVFGAPDGAYIGPIEDTRAITVTTRRGDWVQADVAGSGSVWLRASDVPESAIWPTPAPRPTDPPPPRPAPAAQPAAAPATCTRDVAPYVVHAQVKNGALPMGEYTVWSCTSQADAERQAEIAEAQIRATAAAR